MYVHVLGATKDDIKFSLKSDGRFDGKNNFYTGEVLDPQTGKHMLDRDLERRLWIAGRDRIGKRQSALVMRAYPMMERTESFGLKEKINFLDQCIKVSKYNEDAWLAFARMANNGVFKDDHKVPLARLATLIDSMPGYPDFIWRVFDDLIEPAPLAVKMSQYENVLATFEKARRPDLVCDARLKLSDLQIKDGKHSAAQSGLAATIRKYPNEGRYIPKLMKKIEEVAPNVKGGPNQVAQLYYMIIPGMIVYYQSDRTVYYRKMHEQAKAFLKANKLTEAETALETAITQAQQYVAKMKK
jgi:hypothetical protein